MKTIPMWTDQFPRPLNLSGATLPDEVDVAVVGGGYTGLTAARVIAKKGGRVAVLEKESIGYGASSRNGGMTTTGIKASPETMVKRYGKELGKVFWQASLDAIDLIGDIVAEEEIDCNFVRNGHVALATKPGHFRQMQEKAEWFRRVLDYTVRPVSRADLSEEIGSDAFYGGLVDECSGGLNPAKYVFGLAAAVLQQGAILCEQTMVLHITREGNSFRVETSQGTLKAQEVLLATNGYTDGLVPGVQRRVFPAGSYIIVTEPLSADLQNQVSPKGRMFYTSRRFLHYFRLTPDGRMLFGGRNNLSPNLDLVESAKRLRQMMVGVFPQLKDIPVTHSWTGRLGITFDLMPHIGRVNGIHYALGYAGHGVSIATYLGTEAGLLLCGQKSSSLFAEIPHDTQFFYWGKPWFLPFAALYYRFLDRIT